MIIDKESKLFNIIMFIVDIVLLIGWITILRYSSKAFWVVTIGAGILYSFIRIGIETKLFKCIFKKLGESFINWGDE